MTADLVKRPACPTRHESASAPEREAQHESPCNPARSAPAQECVAKPCLLPARLPDTRRCRRLTRPSPSKRMREISLQRHSHGLPAVDAPARRNQGPEMQKALQPVKVAGLFMVPRRGLEPPRLAAHGPEPCASTNSATWAGGVGGSIKRAAGGVNGRNEEISPHRHFFFARLFAPLLSPFGTGPDIPPRPALAGKARVEALRR